MEHVHGGEKLIVNDIDNGNVTVTMSSNQAMVLLLYLNFGKRGEAMEIIAKKIDDMCVKITPTDVLINLESIRVVLEEYKYGIYPQLIDVEFEPEDGGVPPAPGKPELIH
jgi:hypothetical protein